MSENLIIFNAKVVTPLGFSARKGKEMAELRILEKATVEVVDGIISYLGESGPKNFRGASKGRVICLSCNVAAV